MTDKLIKALAKKFKVEESDFVTLEVDGNTVIMYGASSGIHKGSWDNIMNAPAKDYTVTIDGKEYDTRIGMTSSVYEAFIKHCKDIGMKPLPDNPDLPVWTDTLLTGEGAVGIIVPSRCVNAGGRVYERWVNRGNGSDDVRFRPAVVLPLYSDIATSSEPLSSASSELQKLLQAEYDRGVLAGMDRAIEILKESKTEV